MTKQPLQMKNLVEEWAKQWGYTTNDITNQQGNAPIEWALEIKNAQSALVAFSPKNSDLLRFQCQIDFASEHRQKTADMSNEEYNAFVLNMTDRLAYLGCDWQFTHDVQNPKQMNGLTMFYFTIYDNVDKNTVLQFCNKAFINTSQIIRAINLTLNKSGEPQGTSMQRNSKSIYG